MGAESENVVDEANAVAVAAAADAVAVFGCAAADGVKVRLFDCGVAEASGQDGSESSFRFSRPHLTQ